MIKMQIIAKIIPITSILVRFFVKITKYLDCI